MKLRLRAPDPRLSVTSVPPSPTKDDSVERFRLLQEQARTEEARREIQQQKLALHWARKAQASLLLSAHVAARGMRPRLEDGAGAQRSLAVGRPILPWSDAALQVVTERNAALEAEKRAQQERDDAVARIAAAEEAAQAAAAQSDEAKQAAAALEEKAKDESARSQEIAQSLARAKVAAQLRRDREASLRSALQRAVSELERHVRKSEVERVTVGVQAELEEESDSEYETDSGSEYTEVTGGDELAVGLGQSGAGRAETPPPPPTVALSEAASSVGPTTPARDRDSVAGEAAPPPPPVGAQ